ncbi:hypothetical protein [Rhodopirellula baltica]|uniref:Uncharacterized protein n=1 Tax=Rhodopirellula baltica SWK14 TaxID=993516 RepID=L7CF54_RHOBT|nr:hypothetical protein [Rhodopirellula baltica]ELP32884.1 hypothetical protein RBSWK_03176 [Rhodopirellula baltica SWK14]
MTTQMKTHAAITIAALAAFWLGGSFSSAQPPTTERGKFEQLPKRLEGIYVVSTGLESGTMIALVNPEFRSLEGRPFLVGVVSEKNGFIRDTPFTDGVTYIPVKTIISIQQLMIAD